MTSLHETLPILEAAVPAVAPKVEGVAKDADAFQQAVRDLIANVAEKEEQARALLERVQSALESVQDGAERMDEELVRSLETAEGAVEDALGALADGRGELRTALQSAGDGMEDLKTHVLDGGSRIEGARQDAGQALDGVGEGIVTERGELDGAVGSVEAAADTVEQALAQGRTMLDEAVAELGATLSSLLDDVRARFVAAQNRLTSGKDAHEAVVEEIVSDVVSRGDDLVRVLREQVETQIREALTATMADVTAALGELGEGVAQAQEECRASHEELSERFTELLSAIPTLQVGVEQVKQAANTAGIAWP